MLKNYIVTPPASDEDDELDELQESYGDLEEFFDALLDDGLSLCHGCEERVPDVSLVGGFCFNCLEGDK